MNKIILLISLCFLSYLKGHSQSFLKAEGHDIVNENGEAVMLRGIGLGGWMLQEGYMLKTSGAQHTIEARIVELVGQQKKEEFYDAWLENHFRKIDADSMASWGFNSIRLPMHYKLFTPPIEEEPVPGQITWLEKGFEMTDQLLEWCKANNMYLILDLHAAPGGQGKNADINDYDPSKPSLWESEANQEKTIALWRKLAERYSNEPMIGGYDLINEPNWGFQNISSDPNGCSESQNALLWDLQRRITAAIREVDQNHLVIIEGNCWGNNYSGLPELWDDNLVISFHKYWNPNNQNAIQGMLNLREERNVPLYLGESGENSNAWFTDAISLVEENGIGWAWWPLKKLGSNNALEIKSNPGYQAVVDFWNGGGAKPSEEGAFQGLMQLTEDLKLENNIYRKDVVDAMIRQPHSDEAIPFKNVVIFSEENTIIFAADYDLGRQGIGYHDTEYTNTTGNAGGQAWNLGYSYRNDGVDIEICEDEVTNGYNVGWIETGEWLQYTVQVEKAGNYDLHVRTAATNANGRISLSSGGVKISESINLPNTGGFQTWATTTFKDIYLKSGVNVLRINMDEGGFNLNYIEFEGPKTPSSDQPGLINKTGYHGGKLIELTYNQAFNPVPSDHGFAITREGENMNISKVYTKEGYDQVIVLELEQALVFGDKLMIAYSESGISTVSGIFLESFSGLNLIVFADGPPPVTVPGRIRAEHFAVNSGFELEASSDTGGGQNVGYTDPGDYLDFWVMVQDPGLYKVDYRVASQSAGGALKLQFVNEGNVIDLSTISFPATGGWQTWKTFTGTSTYLDAGLQTLRLLSEGSLFNINWIELSATSEEEPLVVNEQDFGRSVEVYPNPSSGSFTLRFKDPSQIPDKLQILNLEGKELLQVEVEKKGVQVEVEHFLYSGFCFLVYEVQGRKITKKLLIY